MAANITFFKVTGGRDVPSHEGRRSEDIAVGASSTVGALSSEAGDFVRIVSTEDIRIDISDAPSASATDTIVLNRQIIDFGPLPAGISVAVRSL